MEREIESVWDYPRPPRLEDTSDRIVVTHHGVVIADTKAPLRVLETSHPPTYYLPFSDIDMSLIEPVEGASMCEWKRGCQVRRHRRRRGPAFSCGLVVPHTHPRVC